MTDTESSEKRSLEEKSLETNCDLIRSTLSLCRRKDIDALKIIESFLRVNEKYSLDISSEEYKEIIGEFRKSIDDFYKSLDELLFKKQYNLSQK